MSELTENAIRPDDMMKESDRLHAIDLQWLLARQERFVEVACPACERREPTPLWNKGGFRYDRCGACRTGYLNPRPLPETLDEYYRLAENYNFWEKHVFPASEGPRREQIARPRVQRVVELCSEKGVGGGILVEVGAGYGTFCEEIARTGRFSRVIAIEPTPSMAQACRNRGLEVLETPIEQVTMEQELADVIVSFEVIEHLFSPRDFLRSCAKLLKPGGLLALTCPSVDGFDVVTLGAVSQVVDPEHLNYFHPSSLSLLYQRCGFEVVELRTPGRLDAEIVRKRTLAGLHDLSGHPFLEQVLLRDWERVGGAFQDFLAANLLSSHMWIAGRKR
ncbi:MAG: class I SAM-dependent methyltransferase [Gemmatimonadales bacterium]|nr:class I SAM-dependent methyltransferase [Gemmatimonadales bacterium]